MKKGIAVWLIALLCALMVFAGTAAAETSGTCGDNASWTLSDAGVLTITGSGKITSHPWTGEDTISLVKEVSIGKGITEICGSALAKCSALTKVTLPDTLTTIGAYAFYFCSSLPEITIPDSVKEIGVYAFENGILGHPEDLVIYVSSTAAGELVSKANMFFRLKGQKGIYL